MRKNKDSGANDVTKDSSIPGTINASPREEPVVGTRIRSFLHFQRLCARPAVLLHALHIEFRKGDIRHQFGTER